MIRVIAAAVLMCTLLSCQKQYCWKCQTTTVVSPTGDVSHSNANVCDKTEKEIRQYEKDHTTQNDRKFWWADSHVEHHYFMQ
jgi:hypothetical protein